MIEPTYASIAPLVEAQKQDTNVLRVTFRCPRSGLTVKADAVLESHETAGTVARDVAKREAAWGLFRWVSSTVSSLFGGGVAGEIAGEIGGEVAYDQVDSRGNFVFTEEEKQAAVLEAFRNVEDQFEFDEQAGQWVMKRS